MGNYEEMFRNIGKFYGNYEKNLGKFGKFLKKCLENL